MSLQLRVCSDLPAHAKPQEASADSAVCSTRRDIRTSCLSDRDGFFSKGCQPRRVARLLGNHSSHPWFDASPVDFSKIQKFILKRCLGGKKKKHIKALFPEITFLDPMWGSVSLFIYFSFYLRFATDQRDVQPETSDFHRWRRRHHWERSQQLLCVPSVFHTQTQLWASPQGASEYFISDEQIINSSYSAHDKQAFGHFQSTAWKSSWIEKHCMCPSVDVVTRSPCLPPPLTARPSIITKLLAYSRWQVRGPAAGPPAAQAAIGTRWFVTRNF